MSTAVVRLLLAVVASATFRFCPIQCAGSLDLEELNGRELRVFFNVNPPSVTFDDGEYGGYLVSMLNTIAYQAGFKVIPTNLSEDALAVSRVPWVACPLDTAAERVDLCLGTWWETPERREITPFTATMFPASFMLVVPSYTINEGLGVSQVFYPFTWSLWAVVLATIACSSVLILAMENGRSEDFHPSWGLPYSTGVSLYLTFVGLWQGGPVHSPKTMPGRIVVAGYSFFILIVTATYTANLAAFLAASNTRLGFAGLEEAHSRGALVCSSKDNHGSLAALYPGLRLADARIKDSLNGLLRPVTDPLDSWNMGLTCDASVVYTDELETYREGELCSINYVGSTLFTIPVALPCVRSVEPVLSYYITRMRARGDLIALKTKIPNKCNMMTDEDTTRRRSLLTEWSPAGIDDDSAFVQHPGGGGGGGRSLLKAAGKKGAASSAAVVAASGGGLSDSQKIDIDQMKGAFLVYSTFVTAGILLAGYKYCKARWWRTKQADPKGHDEVNGASGDVKWDANGHGGGGDVVQLLKALLQEVRTLKQDQAQMAKVLEDMQYERSFTASGAQNQGKLMPSDLEMEIAAGMMSSPPPEASSATNTI